MRAIQSKRIMAMAREERRGEEGVTERALAQKRSGSVVNSPHTIRAMYLQLKRRFNFLMRFNRSMQELRELNVREAARAAGETVKSLFGGRGPKEREPVKQKPDRIAKVENPLMLILQHCQPTVKKDPLTGEMMAIPHPEYRKARLLADRGDGVAVKRMAAQFA